MSHKHRSFLWISLLLVLILPACTLAKPWARATITPAPTLTPSPTLRPTHTSTITPLPSPTNTPTLTPEPTLTPTPQLLAQAGEPLPKTLPPITPENAAQVSGLAGWQEPAVSDLAWTPDGMLLAVASPEQIHFYDPETRERLRTLHPVRTGILDIAFSPPGNWLAVGSRTGTLEEGFGSSVELWFGPNWKPLGVLYGAPRGLNHMAFSPDGYYLAAVFSSPNSYENSVEFFNTLTWAISDTLSTGPMLNVAFSPDGSMLAISPDRYAIRVWDAEEKESIYTLHTSFTGAVNALAFSPDSGVLASGHYDGMVRIWDMQTGELMHEFNTGAVVQSLVFSPDGRLLATGGSFENSLIQLWTAGSGLLLRQLEGHPDGVVSLAFSPDNRLLASASYDGTVRLWGIRP